jgi:hypothetical protein
MDVVDAVARVDFRQHGAVAAHVHHLGERVAPDEQMARCNVEAQAVRTTSATRRIPRRDGFMCLEIDGDGAIFVFQVRIDQFRS